MDWYYWLAIVSLSICLLSCIYHAYRIISLGNPPEYARRAGNIGKAVRYSFTGAMSPKVKESAYLHMPTYLAGIIYHLREDHCPGCCQWPPRPPKVQCAWMPMTD